MTELEQDEIARFLTHVDRSDLFAYFTCPANESLEKRARVVTDRRKWAQGQQSNPKYRPEALFVIRNHRLMLRLMTEESPAYEDHVRARRKERQAEMFGTFVETVLRAGPLGVGGETAILHYGVGLGLPLSEVHTRLTAARSADRPLFAEVEDLTEDVGEGGWRLPPAQGEYFLPPPRAEAATLVVLRPPPPVAPEQGVSLDAGGAASPVSVRMDDPTPPPIQMVMPAGDATPLPPAPLQMDHPEPTGWLQLIWSWLYWRRRAPPIPVAEPTPRTPEPVHLRVLETSVFPWEGVETLPSLGLDGVRMHLLARLHPLRDQLRSEGDAAFLSRLIRACSSAQLQFPLFPDSALRLDAVLRDDDSPIAEVSALVHHEPALVQRVWEESCSAFYGSTPPANLDAAIVRIGRRSLWRIGMLACVNAPVFRVRGWQQQANDVRYTGVVAAEVAERLFPDAEPFLPALLHAVGQLIVYRAAISRPPVPEPDRAFVTQVARSLQAGLGVLVAGTWQLGPGVVAGIGCFADPDTAAKGWRPTARAVRIGTIAAHEALANLRGESYGAVSALQALSLTEERARKAVAYAKEAWATVPDAPRE